MASPGFIGGGGNKSVYNAATGAISGNSFTGRNTNLGTPISGTGYNPVPSTGNPANSVSGGESVSPVAQAAGIEAGGSITPSGPFTRALSRVPSAGTGGESPFRGGGFGHTGLGYADAHRALAGSGGPTMSPGFMGGGMNFAAAENITANAAIAEAQALKDSIEELGKISAEMRKIGISPEVIRDAEKNLLALSAGRGQHLDNPSFRTAVDFIQKQTARRLSPRGYAPGEHTYGDTVISNVVGDLTFDWTKWWGDHNRMVAGMGNDLARFGYQGALEAGRSAIEYNPAGLAYGAVAGQAQNLAAMGFNPESAWQGFTNFTGRDRFPQLAGLFA